MLNDSENKDGSGISEINTNIRFVKFVKVVVLDIFKTKNYVSKINGD